MVDHSLAIHHFQTNLALTGLREDGPPLVREFNRTVGEILPAALGRTLERRLGDRDGILRIDHITLTLGLGRSDLSSLRLADLLAREIAEVIAAQAEVGGATPHIGAGVAFWPDHASFAAAYLAHRLRLAYAPEWAFPDFRPLDYLTPDEAMLELVAARPAILSALARLLGTSAASALAGRLPKAIAATLVERLLAETPEVLPADAEPQLAAMMATLSGDPEVNPASSVIAAATAALAARPLVDDRFVRQIALLARLAVALATLRRVTLAAWGRLPNVTDLHPDSFVHLPQPARRLIEAALVPLVHAETVRTALAALLDRASRQTAPTARPAVPPAVSQAPPSAITSRNAGVGLLLPTALARGLSDRLSPAALHRTLTTALGPDVVAARLDPLFAALAPFDPRDPEPGFPPVPDALRNLVPVPLRKGEAAAEGAAGWAACLMHAFAAGLTGFEASSLDYVRRQFLNRSGTLHVAGDRLTLVLDPLPLGILLRLSGLHGWTGRLPQVRGARLRIEIREG